MFSASAQFHRSTTGSSSPAARAGWPPHILEEQSLSKLLQHPGKETYGADRNLYQGQSFDLRASPWIDICSGRVKYDLSSYIEAFSFGNDLPASYN